MGKIKSAYETALERLKQRGEVPRREIDRMESVPVGKALAANFLKQKDYNILAEIGRHPENIREFFIEGARETFLNNILLPADSSTMETNKRAMEGLLQITNDKRRIGEVFSQLEYLFHYYEQSLAQAYSQFKESYAAKIGAVLEQRIGTRMKVDPEKQPGFREEWMKYQSRLNSQYEGLLAEQKENLRKVITGH